MAPSQPASREAFAGVGWLLLLSAVAVAPVWAFKYFPTTDGGAHVANADVLLQYFRPAGSAYRQYYELTPLPLPNSLGHFLLALFMSFLPPLVAEKVFVSAYVMLLPLAIRYAVTAVRRSAGWLAFLAVPLSLNWIFHQGFFNFLISVVIFFFLMGYWLRRRETMTPKRAAVLGLLGLILYFGHLLSIMLACATLLILASWFTIAHAWQFRRHGLLTWQRIWPGLYSRGILTFAGLIPAIGLVAWFQMRGFAGKPAGLKLAILKPEFWKNLVTLPILISYRARYERPMALLLAALFMALVLITLLHKIRSLQWNRRDGLLLIPLAFTGLYFTRGDADSGQLFIPQRLLFYTYLTTILFLAAQAFTPWAKRGVVIVSALLVVGLTAAHWPVYREYNAQLEEFLSVAERIDPQSTLLPLVLAPRGMPAVVDADGLRSMPFFSAAGYAAVARHAVDLRNYEAGLDYFPVKFRTAINPYKHLTIPRKKENGLSMVPQLFNLRKYAQTTPGRADYVVVWGINENFEADKPTDRDQKRKDKAELLRQLQLDYTLIHSSPADRTQLWRLRTQTR